MPYPYNDYVGPPYDVVCAICKAAIGTACLIKVRDGQQFTVGPHAERVHDSRAKETASKCKHNVLLTIPCVYCSIEQRGKYINTRCRNCGQSLTGDEQAKHGYCSKCSVEATTF